jgi:urease accessory protein
MRPSVRTSNCESNCTERWPASLSLKLADLHGRTALVEKSQSGPLSIQRPFYPEGDIAHLYLLHPPGGVAGGDDLEIRVSLAETATALVTTPGATKFYRSKGPDATLCQWLQVDAGATLEWFPQENILFPGANVRMVTDIRLRGDARVAAWEISCFGRPAVGERFEHGAVDARLDLYRDDRPLLRERLRVDRPADLDGTSGLRGFPVAATLLMTGAVTDTLAEARAVAVERPAELVHGLTLVEDVLIARVLATTTEPVRRLFDALWRVWRARVVGQPACPPRIWAT